MKGNLIIVSLIMLCPFLSQSQEWKGIGVPSLWLKHDDKEISEAFNYNAYSVSDRQMTPIEFLKSDEISIYIVYLRKHEGPVAQLESQQEDVSFHTDFVRYSGISDIDSRQYKSNFVFYLGPVSQNSALFQPTNGDKIKLDFNFLGNNNNQLEIAEVLAFNKILNKKQREKVNTYFAIKYGISLPLDQNYVSGIGTLLWSKTDEFNEKITGIGYDEFSYLNQTKSKNTELSNGIWFEIEDPKLYSGNDNYLLWAGKSNASNNRSDAIKLWKCKLRGYDIYDQKFIIRYQSNSKEKQYMHLYKQLPSDKQIPDASFEMIKENNETWMAKSISLDLGYEKSDEVYISISNIPQCSANIGNQANCQDEKANIILESSTNLNFDEITWKHLSSGEEFQIDLGKRELKVPFGTSTIKYKKNGATVCMNKIEVKRTNCQNKNELHIFPNPSISGKDVSIVLYGLKDDEYPINCEIRDVNGRLVHQEKWYSDFQNYKTTGLSAGQYVLTATAATFKSSTVFIIQ